MNRFSNSAHHHFHLFKKFSFFILLSLSIYSANGQVVFKLSSAIGLDEVQLDVRVENFESLVNFQFPVVWDTSRLEFITMSNVHSDFTISGFSTIAFFQHSSGNVHLFWNNPSLIQVTIPDEGILFSLHFKVKVPSLAMINSKAGWE